MTELVPAWERVISTTTPNARGVLAMRSGVVAFSDPTIFLYTDSGSEVNTADWPESALLLESALELESGDVVALFMVPPLNAELRRYRATDLGEMGSPVSLSPVGSAALAETAAGGLYSLVYRPGRTPPMELLTIGDSMVEATVPVATADAYFVSGSGIELPDGALAFCGISPSELNAGVPRLLRIVPATGALDVMDLDVDAPAELSPGCFLEPLGSGLAAVWFAREEEGRFVRGLLLDNLARTIITGPGPGVHATGSEHTGPGAVADGMLIADASVEQVTLLRFTANATAQESLALAIPSGAQVEEVALDGNGAAAYVLVGLYPALGSELRLVRVETLP